MQGTSSGMAALALLENGSSYVNFSHYGERDHGYWPTDGSLCQAHLHVRLHSEKQNTAFSQRRNTRSHPVTESSSKSFSA